jgi:hypothetical protein
LAVSHTSFAGTAVHAVAGLESANVVDCRRIIDLLVTAASQLEDSEWKNLSPGMYSLLSRVEPLAILREFALSAAPDAGGMPRLRVAS